MAGQIQVMKVAGEEARGESQDPKLLETTILSLGLANFAEFDPAVMAADYHLTLVDFRLTQIARVELDFEEVECLNPLGLLRSDCLWGQLDP